MALQTHSNNPTQGVDPQATNNPRRGIDFFTARLDGLGDKTIKQSADLSGMEVVLFPFERYKQQFPEIPEEILREKYSGLEQEFKNMQLGNYQQRVSSFERITQLQHSPAWERLGVPMSPKEPSDIRPMRPDIYYGPGRFSQGVQVISRDQLARSIPYLLDKNNNPIPNTWTNRFASNIAIVENPDITSPLPYIYKKLPFGAERLVQEDVRSIFGAQRLQTSTFGSILPVAGVISGSLGLTFNALSAVTGIVDDLIQHTFHREDFNNFEDGFVGKISNSLSNIGASINHANKDQQLRPFDDLSSFTYNIFNLFGQVMAMRAVVGASVAAGTTKFAPQIGLGFMSAQAAGSVYNSAIESGATSGDAAKIFFSHLATTYVASNIIRANILQTPIAKKVTRQNQESAGVLAKRWKDASGAALPSQIADHTANASTKAFTKNWLTGIRDFTKQGGGFRQLADKHTPLKLIGGGLEEGFEEIIENIGYAGLGRVFNNEIFIPQALSIVRQHEIGQYEYFVERDASGIPSYYKRPKHGTKIALTHNVWEKEQKDLASARNILAGNLPLQETVNLDEALMAAIGSFFGGGAIHYLSGAHKARIDNDQELLVEKLASHISELSPKKQGKAILEIGERLAKEQRERAIFGPNHLDFQGNVVKAGTGTLPASEVAIKTFIDDIRLTVELINSSGIKDPSALSAMRGNKYLETEAIRLLKVNRALNTAIEQKNNDQEVTPFEKLFNNDTSLEDLTKMLGATQKLFSDIITPKDGVDGKETSLRYSQIFLDHKLNKYLVDSEAEKMAIAYFRALNKDPDYMPDVNDPMFIKQKDNYIAQIKADPKKIIMLNWFKDPSKYFEGFKWEDTKGEIYNFLDQSYKGNIGLEMEAVATEINERIKTAQGIASNQTMMQDLVFRVRDSKKIDLLVGKDQNFTSEQRKQITAELGALDDILQEFLDINALSPYSEQLAQRAGMYAEVYNEIKSTLDDYQAQATRIQQVAATRGMPEMEAESQQDWEMSYTPSQDAENYAGQMLGTIEKFRDALTAQEGSLVTDAQGKLHAKYTNAIGNLHQELPQVQLDIRAQAMERLIAMIPRGNVTGHNLKSLHDTLTEIRDQLKQNQQVANPAAIVDLLEMFIKNSEYINTIVKLQTDFLQNLPASEAEHSMLRDSKFSHLLFTKAERDHIVKRTDDLIKEMNAMLESEKLKIHSRDFAQVREMVRHIEIRHFHLGEVIEHLEDELKDNPELEALRKGYIEIAKKLDDTSNKKNGMAQFRVWLQDYYNDSAQTSSQKDEILKAIYEVEAAIVNMESMLGGKLIKFMETKAREMMKKTGRGFSNLPDFLTESPVDHAAIKIEGVYNAERFHSHESDIDVQPVYYWSVITWANNLNRIGKSINGKAIPGIKEIAEAYKKVLASRQPTQQQIGENIATPVAQINVASYVQEKTLFDLAGFLLNPEQSAFREAKNENVITASLFVRAYAGSGKTKQLLVDLYQTLDVLNGQSTSITIVSPTKWLAHDHQRNFDIIGKTDFNIVSPKELLSGKAKLNEVVIFDDSSIYGDSTLLQMRDKIGARRSIWLGDESQSPDLRYIDVTLPIKRVALERTYPWTEVFRTGNPDHFKLDDYFRSLSMGILRPSPTVSYEYTNGTDIKGARYYQDKIQIRDGFIKEWESTPDELRRKEKLVYVVPSESDRIEFHRYLTNRFNNDTKAISEIMNLVFISEYDIENANTSVIGLGADKVFYEFDAEEFTRRISKEIGEYNTSLSAARDGIRANTGRIGYTGVSRRKVFVGLIGDPNLSTEGSTHFFDVAVDNSAKMKLRQAAIERLNKVYGKPAIQPLVEPVRIAEEEPIDEKPVEKINVFDRSYQLTEVSRQDILQSQEYINFRTQLLEKNREELFDLEGKAQVYHATDIAFETIKHKIKNTDPEFKENHQIRKTRNAMLTQILRFHFSRDESFRDAAFRSMDSLNELYKNIDPNHANIIKSKQGLFMSIYSSIASDLNFVVDDPLSIVSPLFLKNDATVIIDNKEQKTNLQASPALLKVVGFDKEGNPIVDILEFSVHGTPESITGSPGVYTKAKLAMYVAMAEQGSFMFNDKPQKIKINRVFVSDYLDTHGRLQYSGTYQVSDGDVIEYLKSLEPYFPDIKNSGMTAEDIFVSEDAFYNNERTVNNKDVQIRTSFYKGAKKNENRVFVTHVTKKKDKDNNVTETVHFNDHARVASSLPLNEFLSTYTHASSTEILSQNQLFNARAEIHSEEGSVMSHALVFSPLEVGNTGNFDELTTSPSFRSRMKLLGSIEVGEKIIKRYNGKLDLVKYNHSTDKYTRKSFAHVITNELTDKYLNNNEDLVRNTLKDAELKGHDLSDFAEVLKLFKEHWLHIISFDNVPEAGFGPNNSLIDNNSALGWLSVYLNSPQDSEQGIEAFARLSNVIETSFDKKDDYYKKLVDYNIAKLVSMKALYEASKTGEGIEASIGSIRIGNLKRSNVNRTASYFIEEMNKRGFTHGEPFIITNTFGRKSFGIEFSRIGIPDTVTVEFDAKPATLAYISELKSKLTDFIKNSDALKAHEELMRSLIAKDPKTLTDEDTKEIKAGAHAGYVMLEQEPAFQFIAANLSAILKIEKFINQVIISKRKGEAASAANFTGMLLQTDPRGVKVLGDTTTKKAENLSAILTALSDIIRHKTKVDGQEIELRVNPFVIHEVEGARGDTEIEILIDALQTKTEIIKNPEVYVNMDLADPNQKPHVEPTTEHLKAFPYVTAVDLDEFNSESIEQHLADIRQVIGDAGSKYGIQLKPFELQGENGMTVYGALHGRIIKLYGKELHGKQMALKNVGRHESMHFVMKYLLDRKSYNAIMNEVAQRLNINYSADTETIIHEHIADSFMTMSETKKPETLWERFIQALKEIANYLGFYTLSYNEMMVAADSGFFANMSHHPEANTETDEFYSRRHVNRWSQPEVVQYAVEKVGDRKLFDTVKNMYLLPKLKGNLPVGKKMTNFTNDPASALYVTVADMIRWEQTSKISEIKHVVNGIEKAVKDFTVDDLRYTIRNNMDVAFKEYSVYLLNDRGVIMPMLQEMFPNMDVQEMFLTGREIVKHAKATNTFQDNVSGETNVFGGQTKSYKNSITDVMELMLSTVPYYQYTSESIIRAKGITAATLFSTNFVNPTVVKNIFIDAIQKIKGKGDIKDIDRVMLFNTIKESLGNKNIDTYTRNAIYSVLLEFGNEANLLPGDPGTGFSRKHNIQFGQLVQTGYLHILNNLEWLDRASKQKGTPFADRKQAYEDLFSGLIKTFGSTTVDRTGVVNAQTHKVNVLTNSTQDIERSILQPLIKDKIFDHEGFIVDELGFQLNGINKGGSFDVFDYGFNYKSNVFTEGRQSSYSRYTNLSNITAAEARAIFKEFGVDNISVNVFNSIDWRGKQGKENKILQIVHRMLVISKVNHALSVEIKKEVDRLSLLHEKEDNVRGGINVMKRAIENLSEADKKLFDFMMLRIYNGRYREGTGVLEFGKYFFETKIDAHFMLGGTEMYQQLQIPSIFDIYTDIEELAQIISDARASTISGNNRTPDGELIHPFRKEGAVDELFFGSKAHLKSIRADLRKDGVFNPLVEMIDGIVHYNNPALSNKIAYHSAYYLLGGKNHYKSRDFDKYGKYDFYVTMIETLISKEVISRFGSPRYNVVMTPLAEQQRGLVIPFYFPAPRVGAQKFLIPDYEKNKLVGVDVDRVLLTNAVNDIVKYYEARQNKSLNLIMEVMQEESIEKVRDKAINQTVITVPAKKVRDVREKLVVNRDYVVVKENKGLNNNYSIDIVYGAAAHMNGVIFNHNFRETWNNIEVEGRQMGLSDIKIAFSRYHLLKSEMAGDFKMFANDLIELGVYEYFQRENSTIPKVLLEDFSPEFTETLKGYAAQVNELKSVWLENDAQTQSLFPGLRTTDELFTHDTTIANAIYSRLMQDAVLQKNINALKNKSKRLKKNDQLNRLRLIAGLPPLGRKKKAEAQEKTPQEILEQEAIQQEMQANKWPELMEGVFMLHWLANETIGTIVRGDITNYANITEYVKRGHGYKAPGNGFDLGNSRGMGENSNYAIMEDIPGYNEFLGVAPGSKSGRKLWTDGVIWTLPMTQVLMKRSHGGIFGNINKNVNKTVLYGRDFEKDLTYYFKMAMAPITQEMYENGLFYRNMFNTMLGKYNPNYVSVFEQKYAETQNFEAAVEWMADWLTDPQNSNVDPITNQSVLPRDQIVHFIAHESVFKNNATGINRYIYNETDTKLWSPDNISTPEINVVHQVSNRFLKLQNINNSDGNERLHSFATQLFSVVGVGEHNAPYYNAIQQGLANKTDEITAEIDKVIASIEGMDVTVLRDYLYNKVRTVAGKSLLATRYEELLEKKADPNTFKRKLIETFMSYLNSHLKPDVPGHNAVQQPLLMNIYKSTVDGGVFLPNDLGQPNDSQIIPGYNKRLLKPLTFNRRDGTEFKSKQELYEFFKTNENAKDEVVVVPGEIITRFHHLRKFGLNEQSSLAQVMSITNSMGEKVSLYEDGLQRSLGKGAISGLASGLNILQITQAKTINELIQSLDDTSVKERVIKYVHGIARRNADDQGLLGKKEDGSRLSKQLAWPVISNEFEKIINLSLDAADGQTITDDAQRIVTFIGSYFYDLNNALDVMSVRIPTSGAGSASPGRIVAFFNSAGNTIYTSAEKNILDGSDYDYDELHVFYHKLKGLGIDRADFANIVLDNMLNFYKDSRNHKAIAMPIDLSSMRARALKNEEIGSKPTVIHTMPTHVETMDTFFAGEDLVGHFANQMRYTNYLMAMPFVLKSKTLHPTIQNVFPFTTQTEDGGTEQGNHYMEVMQLINNLVNAAVDNPNEGGMLGKIYIKGALTNLMLGMTVSKQITDLSTIEDLVLDTLSSPVLNLAVRRVANSKRLTYLGAGTNLYEALSYYEQDSPEYKAEASVLKRDAYIGEQINRLGSILRLIQEIPGKEFSYQNKVNEINFALGQDLRLFLGVENLTAVNELDIRNAVSYTSEVNNQIEYLRNEYYTKKEADRFIEHEQEIRSFVNIKTIIANDPYLIAQLRAIDSKQRLRELLFFPDKHIKMKELALAKTGRSRLAYEDEINDIGNIFDKMLIGTYFSTTNHVVDLRYFVVDQTSNKSMREKSFDMSDMKQVVDFLNTMPDYIEYLKTLYPKNTFLKRIDTEILFEKPIRVLIMKNSNYATPSEKIQYREDFRHLTEIDPAAAQAIRFYQPIVYGFSFRNGSFADAIDTGFEQMFTQHMPVIEQTLAENFTNDPETVAAEIAFMTESMPQPVGVNKESDYDFYMRTSGLSSTPSYYMKKLIDPQSDRQYSDHQGGYLVNVLFPKELFIYKHGSMLTNDFVYDRFTGSQLRALNENKVITKKTLGFVGVYDKNYGEVKKRDGKPTPYRNAPYDGALARTIFNDLVQVKLTGKNTARFTKVEENGKVAQSKISVSNARISARAIDTLVHAVNKSFAGINIQYKTDKTAIRENAIGYFHGGSVHLNLDRVQTDTLFHELSHPLLHIIKHAHPGLYTVLMNEAKTMLEDGDLYALKVEGMYPELSGEDLLNEIVATMVGFNSVEAVEMFLAAQNDMEYKNNAPSIWAHLKALIDRFWSGVISFFKGYDLSIDPNTTSIKELSNQIVQKALKGENVLNISASKMKDILVAAYDVPQYQLAVPAQNLDQLKDLFTDVSTYNKGGVQHPIPHYKRMDMDERVAHFKMLLPSMGYEYYVNGVVYNFNEKTQGHIPQSEWDKVIREQIMVSQDENSMKMKRSILKWLNSSEHKISELQQELGKNNLGEYIYTEEALQEFLRGIHWTPTTKFYLYSEIYKDKDLRPYYHQELIGHDPLVAVEFNHEDQMLISFFNITTQMLGVSDITTHAERKNILGGYLTDGAAKRRHIIDITNKPGDVSNFLMGIAATKFVKGTGKKIHIASVGTVNLQPKRAFFETADSVILTNAAKAMMQIEPFVKDLSPFMQEAINDFSLIRVGFSFERLLAKKYMDEEAVIPGLEDFYKGGMDVNDKRRMLLRRLKDINNQTLLHLSNAALQEIRLIVDALSVLDYGMIMSDQINSKKDFSVLEQYIIPQFDANHPAIDLIRKTVINTSMKIVSQMKEFKETIDPFAQHFMDTFEQDNPSFLKYVYDIGPRYYDRIIAHVIDDKGVKRNSGFILWTKDKELDPLFHEQARELDQKDLEMGKKFVDLVTEILTENIYHRKVSKRGEYFYDPQLKHKRIYTKQDALNDLLTETTYRKGMIPLMPDTVSGMAGKGQFLQSIIKHKKQIESSYVMFDEMAQMSESEANFIDTMPDQFMQQFLYNPSGDMIGSLGLQGKRMRELLGLTEIVKLNSKIEYVYDAEANKAAGLNTDLEILLEFLNMTTLRKINYENDVLPLINGAKTYLLDTHTNQQFKQANVLKYIDMYTRQAIEAKRVKLDLTIGGVNLDSTAQMAMSIASPLVMTLNFNVGIVSATHNGMMAFVEGVTNSLTDSHWAGATETVKASGLFFSDWHKVTQLMDQYQAINPNDYEVVTHRYHQKRKKHLISDFVANWTNWASDAYARGVMMTAQMLKDGSYHAHSYDGKTGRTKYDPSKDKRFEIYFKKDESHPEYFKQKALYEGLKKRLSADGIGLTDGEASQAYSLQEMRALKTLADKYIVGAYGPLERNLLGNFLIGRMFMMFTTWLMSKVSNAFKKGSHITDLGYFEIREDIHGNLVPFWVEEFTEGYMNTVFNMARKLVFDGDTKQFSNMKNYEKKNLIRYTTTIGLFLLMRLLYSMSVNDEDRERRGLMKHVPNLGFIPDWRMVRNISFATSSLLVFPVLLEKTESPFAMMGILRRAFAKGLFGREIKFDNLRYIIPGYGGIHTLMEPFREE